MQAALSNVLGVTAVAHLRTRFLVPALRVLLSNSASAYSAGETTAATETSQAPPSLDERSVQRNQFVSELSSKVLLARLLQSSSVQPTSSPVC